jgi:hypothetical protein
MMLLLCWDLPQWCMMLLLPSQLSAAAPPCRGQGLPSTTAATQRWPALIYVKVAEARVALLSNTAAEQHRVANTAAATEYLQVQGGGNVGALDLAEVLKRSVPHGACWTDPPSASYWQRG